MKIGMFTSGYQRSPLEHCFQDAKEYGYDYIELWGGRPHAYAPDLKAGEMAALRTLIDRYEMPVTGYTPEHNAYPYNYMIGSEAQLPGHRPESYAVRGRYLPRGGSGTARDLGGTGWKSSP